MSLREEQCKKVCRILDDVLANRPTERDALIVAVRTAFDELKKRKPEPHWIPFKHRKPTEEEGTAFDYIMDCKCPEDEQNILVSINIQGHEHVQYDTFYGGGGEECCLESSYELVEEATAWMPLPEPYREGQE